MEKKDGQWKTSISIIIVLIVLLVASIGSRQLAPSHKSQQMGCHCGVLNPKATGPVLSAINPILKFPDPSGGNVTKNGGGWLLYVYQVCHQIPLSKVSVSLYEFYGSGYSLEIPALGEETATAHLKNGTQDWYVYGNGNIYYSDHGNRTWLDPAVPTVLTNVQLYSLENVTMVYMDNYWLGDLSSIDEFLFFKDINADGNNEFRGDLGYSSMSMKWYGEDCGGCNLD